MVNGDSGSEDDADANVLIVMAAKSSAPSALPVMVPIPPKRLVPPMITAVTTWKVRAVPPAEGDAVNNREAQGRQAARARGCPASVRVVTFVPESGRFPGVLGDKSGLWHPRYLGFHEL